MGHLSTLDSGRSPLTLPAAAKPYMFVYCQCPMHAHLLSSSQNILPALHPLLLSSCYLSSRSQLKHYVPPHPCLAQGSLPCAFIPILLPVRWCLSIDLPSGPDSKFCEGRNFNLARLYEYF